jgi:putative ABC transport system substrate-binding protein
MRDLDDPARLLAIQIHALKVLDPGEFENAFRTAVTERASAVWITGDQLFYGNLDRLATLAINARLPTMFGYRQYAEAGGLVAYGPANAEMYLRAATFVDKILKGAKPSDLPIEQPRKFELIINLKTAKAIGLPIPQSLLVRADEIIQ